MSKEHLVIPVLPEMNFAKGIGILDLIDDTAVWERAYWERGMFKLQTWLLHMEVEMTIAKGHREIEEEYERIMARRNGKIDRSIWDFFIESRFGLEMYVPPMPFIFTGNIDF